MSKKVKMAKSFQSYTGMMSEVDRKIMHMLSDNPEVSQSELSKALNISQPAVSLRIKRLEEKGVLARLVGTDIKKAHLFLARVDLSTNKVEEVLKFLEKCPLYLNCFLTSGKHNMSCLMIGENIRSIMSCVDSRLRQNLPVENIEFDLIVSPTRPFIVPVKPKLDRGEVTPCGADCSKCGFYNDERCLGCPASVYYKGIIL